MKAVGSIIFGSCMPMVKIAITESAHPGFESFEVINFSVEICMFDDDMIGASSCRNVTEDGRDASLVEV